MRIEAALMESVNQPLSLKTLNLEGPKANEVLVEIKATGVCHSDWNALRDSSTPCPCVLGHEASGVVREIGSDVKRLKVGDPVVLSWLPYCGTCSYCISGSFALCESAFGPMFAGTLMDGTSRLKSHNQSIFHYSLLSTFATHSVVPEMSCIPLPQGMPFAEASLLGCGVATGYGAVVHSAQVRAGSTVAVFGVGGVGISAIQAAALSGAKQIIACDLKRKNLEWAQKFGATDVIQVSTENAVESIRDLTGGLGVEFAIDATGNPKAFRDAWTALRKGGVLVVVGAFPSSQEITLPGGGFHRVAKTVKGSFYGDIRPLVDLPLLAELYLQGKLKLSDLILERIKLDGINEAFTAFTSQDTLTSGRSVVVF